MSIDAYLWYNAPVVPVEEPYKPSNDFAHVSKVTLGDGAVCVDDGGRRAKLDARGTVQS